MKTQALTSIIRSMWTGAEEITISRMLTWGALIWGLYSAIQLMANGIVLDQVLEPAQIISGSVPYPSEHPRQLRDFTDNGHFYPDHPVWIESWKKRNSKEWQALGRKYKFRLVLSPTKTRLDLPVALEGTLWTLYVIPIPVSYL